MNNLKNFFGYYSIPSPPPEPEKPLTFTAKLGAANIKLVPNGNPLTVNLQYSINGSNWVDYSINSMINLASGDTVSFSGANDHFNKDANNYYKFQMTGYVETAGNIQSLMNFSDSVTNYCYYKLFNGCSSLLCSAPLLPATTLANNCYNSMFTACHNILSAPALPATTLCANCYSEMFGSCISLKNAPELPATTLAKGCYEYMFQSCQNLNKPPALPAKNLAYGCYQGMFSYCSMLTAAPPLPATTLADYCYANMFNSCSNLRTPPELPATILCGYCYQHMFDNSSLISALLPATTLALMCYDSMFAWCYSLSSITVSFTTWNNNYTNYWVQGINTNGTFYKPAALNTVYGYNGIPNNWTVVNK